MSKTIYISPIQDLDNDVNSLANNDK